MKKTNPQLATDIVRKIVDDFTARGGFRQQWEQIDAALQSEILASWLLSTKRILDENDLVVKE